MGNYGRTENVGGRELATANSLAGAPLGSQTAHAAVGSLATMSTAPYKPPRTLEERAKTDSRGLKLCSYGDCKGLPKKGTDRCRHHTGK